MIKLNVSNGNMKIGKDTIIYNITSALDCKSEKLGLCKHPKICYAKKNERRFPKVLKYRRVQEKQWDWLSSVEFANKLIEYINSKKHTIKYFRFNESGDFRNQKDVTKLFLIAKMLFDYKKIITYGYTSRCDLDFSNAPNGCTINGSDFMIHNNFEVVEKRQGVQYGNPCLGNCRICSKCKFRLGKNIQAIKH